MHIEILVKDIRQQKGMTIAGLARKSGVSAAHLSDIEKNFKSPSLLVMVRIARALNVEITELYRVKWWISERRIWKKYDSIKFIYKSNKEHTLWNTME